MSKKYTNTLLKIASNHMIIRFDDFSKAHDMTWMQASIIDFISRNSDIEMFQRDIEKEFFLQRSTVTVLLQRMEKKDLIYRQSSTKDARQKSVFLTQKAHKLEKQINAYMKHQQEILEANFSNAEISTFEKILKFYSDREEH
ncbi:MarR family winged helix-turn-helix transcriptional regulator [Companilactobacillus halodurans]|uniref:MarR family transcriptional regulator n=1 Tax=Companilactobacillus halodurans TaxID=2584183 RepID=A0A5P0ZRC9_9LACO|nr:MarR family transcriptional regulator [Companilactobacillus halodurans]MQS76768.1 MarR family transcriptional regulator [Companilactobacillus halodurans]MQS98020.1 MarR family transcriptional regulator [Companilactobacillus halodurans]